MKHLGYLFIVLFISTYYINAQETKQNPSMDTLATKNLELRILPYITYDRQLGGVFGALPMAMYRLNKEDILSPKSISGATLVYTTNKSWGFFFFNKFYFNQDIYRGVFVVGKGSFNSQFFSEDINSFTDFNSNTFFLKTQLQRRLFPKFYGGLNYMFINRATLVDSEGATETKDKINLVGLIFTYDTRNMVYYPTKGIFTKFRLNTAPHFLGNDRTNNKIQLDYNQYFPMNDSRDVLAGRLYAGIGVGDLEFNEQFVVGRNDIRGYTQSRYRGKQMVDIQGEYRLNPWKKIGLVGFGGIATVFSSDNDSDNGVFLPSIGAGFRYTVFPENKMNIGLEGAVGKDDWGVYFRIGEAF